MILIVDDAADMADIICRLLRAEGYPAQFLTHPVEALAFIRSRSRAEPLLVITDLMMPGMDGVDLLRELREDPATAEVPVIFFTAGFDVQKRDEALALGASAWLLKGSDVQKTLATFGHWYEKTGGVRTHPAGQIRMD